MSNFSLSSQLSHFFAGMKDASVIVLTYLPVAFAFGVAAVNYGFSAWEALFLSCTIYAGASQFLIIALLASGSSLWLAAITVIALDLRHVLYGPALYHHICIPLQMKKTIFWAYTLTDEVFARGLIELSHRQQYWSEAWMIGLSLTSWTSWALGSLLGGILAHQVQYIPLFLQASLDFLLPALFLSFLLAAFNRKQSLIIASALLSSALGCIFVGLSFAIFVGIVFGIAAAIIKQQFLQRNRHES